MFFALQHHVQLDMKASPLEVHEFWILQYLLAVAEIKYTFKKERYKTENLPSSII